jgi:hypothetical protein
MNQKLKAEYISTGLLKATLGNHRIGPSTKTIAIRNARCEKYLPDIEKIAEKFSWIEGYGKWDLISELAIVLITRHFNYAGKNGASERTYVYRILVLAASDIARKVHRRRSLRQDIPFSVLEGKDKNEE